MDYKKLAGKRIKAAREAIGLTQVAVAGHVPGLTPSRLGNFEQGTRYPPPDILVALSKILKEPASYLGGLDDDPSLEALARKYVRMDSRGKDTLHRVAESQPPAYGAQPEIKKDAS
ncbi:helix-turn-helix transcriptional regulator [uncultured Haliea sp.]|uniref:helix-turn-helix domain-containing protein n=1 Tax=uncultured Haliea sp. TaxID=622616 RepID=UPI0030D8A1C6|tara:strand:- start:7754 stop:8101 length:348 start_codon:yes stop_codon:yes gene_type:complete